MQWLPHHRLSSRLCCSSPHSSRMHFLRRIHFHIRTHPLSPKPSIFCSHLTFIAVSLLLLMVTWEAHEQIKAWSSFVVGNASTDETTQFPEVLIDFMQSNIFYGSLQGLNILDLPSLQIKLQTRRPKGWCLSRISKPAPTIGKESVKNTKAVWILFPLRPEWVVQRKVLLSVLTSECVVEEEVCITTAVIHLGLKAKVAFWMTIYLQSP